MIREGRFRCESALGNSLLLPRIPHYRERGVKNQVGYLSSFFLMEDTTIQQLLGRLKALRAARGLTQEQFAEESGISYKYYQAVEAGRKRDLRLSTLDRLAKAHGLEVWQLLLPGGGAEPGVAKPQVRAGKRR